MTSAWRSPARLPPSSSWRVSASLAFCAARFALPLDIGGGLSFMPSRDGLARVEADAACERVLVEVEEEEPFAAAPAGGARCWRI